MKRFICAFLLTALPILGMDYRGCQFLSFTNINDLAAKPITPAVNWDELVMSWNFGGPGEITVEARIIHPDVTTRFYQLGVWSLAERHSVTNQNDEHGKVETDLLRASQPGGKLEARVQFKGANSNQLKFISFAFRDSRFKAEPLAANKGAWGKVVDVGVRSQLDYPEGARIWCSPTSTSMILAYWSQKLSRTELNLTVPEVARAVHDPNWPGTGNWPFNTAFVGQFKGMRGYVTRLADVSELEDWIEAGVPIATSVSYNRLKGQNRSGSGHLIICVGFTETGDVIVNDPGTKLSNVRRTFARDLFRQAWADSGNTVYINYPEETRIPPARHGHWEAR